MKRIYITFIVMLAIAAADCSSEKVKQEELKTATTIGEKASMELMQTLKAQLQQAIQDSGAAYAIRFCNTSALPLTRKVAFNQPDGVTIKRTSERYRNPVNAPDPLEEEVLATLAEAYASGKNTGGPLMRTTNENGHRTYHYFKPMIMAELCTNCHGQRTSMDSAVVRVLDERYPDDRAVGYEAGDFRGVIHVVVAQKAVRRQ